MSTCQACEESGCGVCLEHAQAANTAYHERKHESLGRRAGEIAKALFRRYCETRPVPSVLLSRLGTWSSQKTQGSKTWIVNVGIYPEGASAGTLENEQAGSFPETFFEIEVPPTGEATLKEVGTIPW